MYTLDTDKKCKINEGFVCIDDKDSIIYKEKIKDGLEKLTMPELCREAVFRCQKRDFSASKQEKLTNFLKNKLKNKNNLIQESCLNSSNSSINLNNLN